MCDDDYDMPSDGESRIESLERLASLLEDGRISQEEFDRLKADLLDASPASSSGADRVNRSESSAGRSDGDGYLLGDTARTRPHSKSGIAGGDSLTATTATLYKVGLGLGVASVFLGPGFGLVAWSTIAVSAYALYSIRDEKGRWMAWTGLVLGIVFSFVNLYLMGHLDSLTQGSRWTDSDTATVAAYCVEQGASPICGNLADALRNAGCTPEEAATYIKEEAFRVSNEPPPGSNPITQRRYEPRGIQGAEGFCEYAALFGR